MKIIDLSLEIFDGLQSYSSHPKIEIKLESTFENSRHRYTGDADGFESRMLKMSDHSGTHIDAPLHFIANAQSTSEMDLEQCCGEAILIDVTTLKTAETAVTPNMLNTALEQQGMIVKKGDIVLVRTRTLQWGDGDFFNEAAFAPEVGDWLIEKGVKCVGLDLPNIDIPSNMSRDVHMKILPKPIYIIENLVSLEKLPLNKRFDFMALPLKLKNATASPVRAVAMV